jgi:hypothetical protein
MPNFKLTTPVAFIIFNRPNETKLVFAEIAKAKPPKLLVIADGARKDKEGEVEIVAATRAIIKRVDWDCEVMTNFSDINMGCKARVSSGIDWVFEQVEEAIILEDDCLPDPTFFRFCQEMLDRYRHDLRIGMISGDNFRFGINRNQDSYYFSKNVHIWGWASWRNRWKDVYDVDLNKWPFIRDGKWLVDILGDAKGVSEWTAIFENTYKRKVDTWDYQWVFANWIEGRINVMPNVNLISNIGFNEKATHTLTLTPLANMVTAPMVFPIIHPLAVLRDLEADNSTFQSNFYAPYYKKLLNNLRNLPKSLFNKIGRAIF